MFVTLTSLCNSADITHPTCFEVLTGHLTFTVIIDSIRAWLTGCNSRACGSGSCGGCLSNCWGCGGCGGGCLSNGWGCGGWGGGCWCGWAGCSCN